MQIRMHLYTHSHSHSHAHAHAHAHACTHFCTRTHAHTHTHTHAHVHAHAHTPSYAHVHAWTHTQDEKIVVQKCDELTDVVLDLYEANPATLDTLMLYLPLAMDNEALTKVRARVGPARLGHEVGWLGSLRCQGQ